MRGDNGIVPGKIREPKKSEDEKAGENQDAVDQFLFGGEMHKDGSDEADFKGREEQGDDDVRFLRAEIHIRQSDREGSANNQRGADQQVAFDVLLDAVRVLLVLGRVLGNVRRVVHGLEQIEKRKHKNPDQIDKVPEEAADLDPIGQSLVIILVKPFSDWEPHVNENEHTAGHVGAVQSSNGKVAREIGA